MRSPPSLEPLPNEIEHGHELTEDEHAMTAVDDFFEELVEQIEFRGGSFRRARFLVEHDLRLSYGVEPEHVLVALIQSLDDVPLQVVDG